jgi:hypothetical protein
MTCDLCYKPECRRCAKCKEPECTHHEFVPVVRKPGCICEPDSWRDGVIPPVCDKYVEDDKEYCDYCATCNHNKECHQP